MKSYEAFCASVHQRAELRRRQEQKRKQSVAGGAVCLCCVLVVAVVVRARLAPIPLPGTTQARTEFNTKTTNQAAGVLPRMVVVVQSDATQNYFVLETPDDQKQFMKELKSAQNQASVADAPLDTLEDQAQEFRTAEALLRFLSEQLSPAAEELQSAYDASFFENNALLAVPLQWHAAEPTTVESTGLHTTTTAPQRESQHALSVVETIPDPSEPTEDLHSMPTDPAPETTTMPISTTQPFAATHALQGDVQMILLVPAAKEETK